MCSPGGNPTQRKKSAFGGAVSRGIIGIGLAHQGTTHGPAAAAASAPKTGSTAQEEEDEREEKWQLRRLFSIL